MVATGTMITGDTAVTGTEPRDATAVPFHRRLDPEVCDLRLNSYGCVSLVQALIQPSMPAPTQR